MDPVEHYHQRMRVFEAERPASGGCAFVGSSHVEWFDTDRLLPGYPVVNRGIAGDRLDVDGRGVYRRLDVSVFALAPAYIMLESGTNDLGELWRTDRPRLQEIVAKYERTVAEVRRRLPETPMDLVSVFPTRGAYAGMSPLTAELNPYVERTAERHGCGYIDLYATLVDDDGLCRAAYTDDGLHLNDEGYAVWAEALHPRLDKVFSTQSRS